MLHIDRRESLWESGMALASAMRFVEEGAYVSSLAGGRRRAESVKLDCGLASGLRGSSV